MLAASCKKKIVAIVVFVFVFFVGGRGEGMVMYTHEVETKEKYKLPEIKKLTMTLLNMVRIFVKSNPPYSLELQRDPKSVGFSTTKPSLG